MSVIGIEQVEFVVDDPVAADRYLLQWGLRPVDHRGAVRYACADGSAVSFVEAAAVAGEQRPYPTVRRVVWGVSDAGSLDELTTGLAKDRPVTQDDEGTFHARDDAGLAIGLRLTQKRPLDVKPTLFNTPGAPQRIDQQAAFYDRAVPQEISHIVFGVQDIRAGEAFYRERLGFRVSDRYVNRGVFLRGPAVGHHHNIFLLDEGHHVFNHLAFKVRDIHEVIGGGQALLKQGTDSLVGPGRHFASSGCFWYFKSPFGGALEYVADEDVVTPAWAPSELIPSPERFSEWMFHTGPHMGALKKG